MYMYVVSLTHYEYVTLNRPLFVSWDLP